MKKISIIVPVYYNQDNLLPLYVDLKEKVLTKLNMEYELIFVDDGSKDKSYEVMQNIAKLDKNIITICIFKFLSFFIADHIPSKAYLKLFNKLVFFIFSPTFFLFIHILTL